MRNAGRETGAGQATPTNFEIDRSDRFFCGAGGRVEGATCFFGGQDYTRDFFRNCRVGTRTFLEILINLSAFFPESSARDAIIFWNPQLTARSLLPIRSSRFDLFSGSSAREPMFSGKVRVGSYEAPGLWERIQRMGAVAPIPPRARTSAAPEGTPPRRISEKKTALAPPCPARGPEAGNPRELS
jgi:hypothetical protein